MIDARPKIVEKKSRIGDLEIDTVVGKNHIGALVTVVDRKSKFTLIKNIPSREARVVTKALIEMIQPIKAITYTILTIDLEKCLDTSRRFSCPLGIKLHMKYFLVK